MYHVMQKEMAEHPTLSLTKLQKTFTGDKDIYEWICHIPSNILLKWQTRHCNERENVAHLQSSP